MLCMEWSVWKCNRHQLDAFSSLSPPTILEAYIAMTTRRGSNYGFFYISLLWLQVRCQSHLREFNWWDFAVCGFCFTSRFVSFPSYFLWCCFIVCLWVDDGQTYRKYESIKSHKHLHTFTIHNKPDDECVSVPKRARKSDCCSSIARLHNSGAILNRNRRHKSHHWFVNVEKQLNNSFRLGALERINGSWKCLITWHSLGKSGLARRDHTQSYEKLKY